ncbi:MAG: efflux RND transporter periplasmic adaptor subunit [Chitinophagaceae bacterium]
MKYLPARLPVAGILIAISALLGGCRGGAKPDRNTATPQLPVRALSLQDVTLSENYPATIQGEEVVEIRPRVEGYLEAQYVDEGARVKAGQPLFRISSPQYEQELRSAEAGILSAQANMNAAQMAVNKTRPLVEKEIISKYELESAEYTLNAQKAALAQAQATLANAKANIGYTQVVSPADGIIGTIPYKKGSLVSGRLC